MEEVDFAETAATRAPGTRNRLGCIMKRGAALLGAAALLALSSPANAGRFTAWYFGVDGGANWVEDVDALVYVTPAPPPAAAHRVSTSTWVGRPSHRPVTPSPTIGASNSKRLSPQRGRHDHAAAGRSRRGAGRRTRSVHADGQRALRLRLVERRDAVGRCGRRRGLCAGQNGRHRAKSRSVRRRRRLARLPSARRRQLSDHQLDGSDVELPLPLRHRHRSQRRRNDTGTCRHRRQRPIPRANTR